MRKYFLTYLLILMTILFPACKKSYIEYYENGNKEFEAEDYRDGIVNGKVYLYYENGKLKNSCFFKNNKINGIKKTFNEEGKLIKEVEYVENLENGYFKEYFNNGNIKVNGKLKNGKYIYYKKYDINNNLIDEFYEMNILMVSGDTINYNDTAFAKIKIEGDILDGEIVLRVIVSDYLKSEVELHTLNKEAIYKCPILIPKGKQSIWVELLLPHTKNNQTLMKTIFVK